MDEENKEENKEEPTPDNSGEGVQSETDKRIAELNADTERINLAIAENENAKARQKSSGVAEAGQTVETEDAKAKKLADEISGAFK